MDAVSEKWRVFNRTNVLVWYSFAKQLIKSQANLICIRVNSVTNQVLPFRAASFDLSRPVHCRVPTANTEIFGRCFGLFSTISFYDLFMDRPQFFRENLFHSFVIAHVENSLKIELSWMNLSFIGKSDKLCVSKRAFSRSAERELFWSLVSHFDRLRLFFSRRTLNVCFSVSGSGQFAWQRSAFWLSIQISPAPATSRRWRW